MNKEHESNSKSYNIVSHSIISLNSCDDNNNKPLLQIPPTPKLKRKNATSNLLKFNSFHTFLQKSNILE